MGGTALRVQFRQSRYDGDIEELIRTNKTRMKPLIVIRGISVCRQSCSGYTKVSPVKHEISEISQEVENEVRSAFGSMNDREAFLVVCWNCRVEEHCYQECLSERGVFSYGCGAANTYKPIKVQQVFKKLQGRNVEVARQNEDFECLSKSINHNRSLDNTNSSASLSLPDKPIKPVYSLHYAKF